jgi:hypothetical protein
MGAASLLKSNSGAPGGSTKQMGGSRVPVIRLTTGRCNPDYRRVAPVYRRRGGALGGDAMMARRHGFV